jgi:hypothetical protein
MSLESAFDLAKEVTPRLLPFLPYLIEGVKQVREKILNQLKPDTAVKNTLDVVEHLWKQLKPKMDEQPDVKKAVEEASTQPDDSLKKEALSKAIESILQDETLRRSVAEILRDSTNRGVKLESFVEVGQAYSSVIGVQIGDINDLQGTTVASTVKVKKAIAGGVKGMVIGDAPSLPPAAPPAKRRNRADMKRKK